MHHSEGLWKQRKEVISVCYKTLSQEMDETFLIKEDPTIITQIVT